MLCPRMNPWDLASVFRIFSCQVVVGEKVADNFLGDGMKNIEGKNVYGD